MWCDTDNPSYRVEAQLHGDDKGTFRFPVTVRPALIGFAIRVAAVATIASVLIVAGPLALAAPGIIGVALTLTIGGVTGLAITASVTSHVARLHSVDRPFAARWRRAWVEAATPIDTPTTVEHEVVIDGPPATTTQTAPATLWSPCDVPDCMVSPPPRRHHRHDHTPARPLTPHDGRAPSPPRRA